MAQARTLLLCPSVPLRGRCTDVPSPATVHPRPQDCPACNAGLGSNLSFRGLVECDASLMAGDGAFGAVAAAPGLANPITAAAALAADGRVPLSHGRVRPMLLAGDRAREWALGRGLAAAATPAAAATMHVTPDARRRWERYRAILRGGGRGSGATGSGGGDGSKRRRMGGRPGAGGGGSGGAGQKPEQQAQQVQDSGQVAPAEAAGAAAEEGWALDTVGCVVVDARGCVAAGVSSGGIALKTEGRVGEAAAFGAGCWAQDAGRSSAGSGGQPAVAVSASGVGEHIMRHLLARECALRLAAAGAAADAACGTAAAEDETQQWDGQQTNDAGRVVTELLRQTMLRGPPPRDCGLLAVTAALEGLPPPAAAEAAAVAERSRVGSRARNEGQWASTGSAALCAELVVAHCSRSMAVAHCVLDGGGGVSRPAVAFLRQEAGDEGVHVLLHGSSWQLSQA